MISLILKAVFVKEIFSDFASIEDSYRKFAKQIHPDKNPDPKAEEAFQRLLKAKEIAEKGYNDSTRIDDLPIVNISGKDYVVEDRREGDICDVLISTDVVIKIPKAPKDNDLMEREADVLTALSKDIDAGGYVPKLISSEFVKLEGKRRINILSRNGTVTLAEVIKAFPDGLPLCHAAWIFNRILGAIIITHRNGYIHNGLIPQNFTIVPETHQGFLLNFAGAVKIGEQAKIVTGQKEFHPPEVFAKKPLVPATDLFMAAKVMRQLLGKTPISKRIDALLRACEIENGRINSALEIYDDFKVALSNIFGPPTFVEFKMP